MALRGRRLDIDLDRSGEFEMTLTADEYWNQGTKMVDRYAVQVNAIISSFPEPRRSLVSAMMDGPLGEQFMTAPASTRRTYHNAFPCGLVAHSLNVVMNAGKIASALAPGRWPTDRIFFCALFHDFGKAGSPGHPYYVEVQEDWKRRREEYYEVSKFEFMPNSEKSVWLLQRNGIVLEHEEYAAIRLNDGSVPENRPWEFREPDLALIIHWADMWAMRAEKSLAL